MSALDSPQTPKQRDDILSQGPDELGGDDG